MSRPTYLVAVADGNIYIGYSPTQLTIATNGTNALVDTPFMGMQDAAGSPNDTGDAKFHRHMYFADGTNYKKLDAHTGVVSDWTAFNGVDAVSGDTIAGALPTDSDNNTATILALYRNRMVFSGLAEQPHTWFMSAQGDVRNMDFSPPTPSERQAVAGTNAFFGELGDRVTALIPVSDDLMLFGGDRTLWRLTGDPAAGGVIDNVSQQIGVVGPDAWATDPQGNVYFVGHNGLYRVAGVGGDVVNISENRLDRFFKQVDLTTHRFVLAWDRMRDGLYIFLHVIANNAPVTSLFWDRRADAFWPIVLPESNGPISATIFDTDAVEDRILLLGGRDGFIRAFEDLRPNDNNGADEDGFSIEAAIESEVALTPLRGSVHDEIVASEFRLSMSDDSSPITLLVRTGATVEAALGAGSRVSRQLFPGKNVPAVAPIRGRAIVPVLYDNTLNTRWAYEDGGVVVRHAGRGRRRA